MKFPITSISGATNRVGVLPRCGCPNCYKRVPMVLMETSIRPRIYHIPTIKLRKQIFSICTNCHSQFIPSKKALQLGKTSPRSLIWPSEFEKI